MKIMRDGIVFLQRIDVLCLAALETKVPEGLNWRCKKMVEGLKLKTDADACVFDCWFSISEDVAWIMQQSWIINYDRVKKLSYEKIAKSIKNDVTLFTEFFRYKSGRMTAEEANEEILLAMYRNYSYELLIRHKAGELKFFH